MKKVCLRCLVLLFAAGLMPLLFSSCATDVVSGKNVLNIYSIQDDIKLGQSAVAQNLTQLRKDSTPVNVDPGRLNDLNSMMRRITAASDMPEMPYNVTLIQNKTVNACAFPGGPMMVFAGLYDPQDGLVKDDDEMAAVMAHEIAHVNCRHSTEQLSKIMLAAGAAEGAATIADHNDKSDVANIIRAAFVVGSALWIPTYSRGDEYEADRVGLFYMAKAGYDPRAAPRIWKRVSEKAGDKDKTSIFSTHPGSGDRYKALEKLVPYAMEDYRKAVGHYPAGYTPPAAMPLGPSYNWRLPAKK